MAGVVAAGVVVVVVVEGRRVAVNPPRFSRCHEVVSDGILFGAAVRRRRFDAAHVVDVVVVVVDAVVAIEWNRGV